MGDIHYSTYFYVLWFIDSWNVDDHQILLVLAFTICGLPVPRILDLFNKIEIWTKFIILKAQKDRFTNKCRNLFQLLKTT